MAIPAAVDSLLRKQNIEFGVEEISSETEIPAGAVQTMLLHDGSHRLLVLHAPDTLLDLNAVSQLTGWQLRALPYADVRKLCQQHQMQQIPALPAALGLPTLVDNKILTSETVVLSSGDQSGWLRMSAEQFRQSLAGATLGDFSVSLEKLSRGKFDNCNDLEEITKAVADFTQLRIKQRLEETLEIPPLPDTAQRIIKLRVDPYAEMRGLTNIVEMDPALAAQVVSWAASPYYAAPGKIKSVHDAIVRVLGFDLVLNLALGLALGKSLNLPKDAPKGFTPYWQQAVYAAAAVESLVGCIPADHRPTIGLSYLTGLLHNFGLLLLAEVFPPHFSSYCRFQEANPRSSYTLIERHLLGITRDQLAGWLMRLWSIPDEVCIGLRYQNEADYAGPHCVYANLMFVAMRLLRRHGIGNAPLESIPADVFTRLHLDPDAAAQTIQHVIDASDEIKSIAADLAAA
ncbi:MAG TPA: HDOD domain-containing protein [Spongiibacteraceae bacterium]|jgi:HD-like signal output (HDOD) protein/prolyl-tRNA editing enzyme YbaK/EbsC (Cys-tRNA(Pro) deacylase)